MQELAASIPSRFALSDWRLLYSTHVHGISLNTLYLRCSWCKVPFALLEDSALPCARMVAPRAQAAPAHPGAPPPQLGGVPGTQQPASGRPKDEEFARFHPQEEALHHGAPPTRCLLALPFFPSTGGGELLGVCELRNRLSDDEGEEWRSFDREDERLLATVLQLAALDIGGR